MTDPRAESEGHSEQSRGEQPEYAEDFTIATIRREKGILEVKLHSNEGPLVWGRTAHRECSSLFEAIAKDSQNKVVIMTGTGDSFLTQSGHGPTPPDPESWALSFTEARRFQDALLAIDAPMIAAINGPVTIHTEMPLLCDITLMAEAAYLQDGCHLANGLVPGDGVQIVWPMLLGLNRARYFLITGQKLGAKEALSMGVVNEVMPEPQLLPRAWELARYLLTRPTVALRLTRPAMLHGVKQAMVGGLSLGVMLEGLGALDYWPHAVGGGPKAAPGVDRIQTYV